MNEKRALFFINSLSNGGAERVCINLSEELVKEGYLVDFIVLSDKERTYKVNEKVKIYNLNITCKNKVKKILKIIVSIKKVNKIILNGKYDLITSHLPMANLITRLSKVRNEAIYVFHTTIYSYDTMKYKKIFKLLLNFMYKRKKIVTVSEGVRIEAIQKYDFDANLVKTIYNPINYDKIQKEEQEKVNIKDKYFLQVGRFNNAKRQDRMLEIFCKGEFYKKYKLIFCGVGETEETIRDLVKKRKIADRVVFLGWQSNVYKWMKNAELLVSTSDYEAFPMNLIEAFACNTKVVSSNCECGPAEILIGEYAKFLVKTEDIDEYIEKINLALTDYPKGKNIILEKCNPKEIIAQYLEFYKKIVRR